MKPNPGPYIPGPPPWLRTQPNRDLNEYQELLVVANLLMGPLLVHALINNQPYEQRPWVGLNERWIINRLRLMGSHGN